MDLGKALIRAAEKATKEKTEKVSAQNGEADGSTAAATAGPPKKKVKTNPK